jgi:transcriptional regulator with PAS, ATPase and Fis domain
MPGPLQAKLLRVLEDGSMRRVGSIKERKVNVRILCATNRNLAEEVEVGHFREDLFYRINVMSLELPPIRERTGDIPLLVAHFLGPGWEIELDAMQALERYRWPGNIRQLLNSLERGKIMSEGCTVRLTDLPREICDTSSDVVHTSRCDCDDLASIERAKVLEVLRRENGNKTRAARVLGVDRRKIYRLVEKYTIKNEEIHTAE